MGVLYMVWPVEAQMREWLTSQAIDAPSTDSRWPSKLEVQAALNRLRGFQVRVTDNGPGARWDAFVECSAAADLWTLLQAKPKDGADDANEITFEKGDPTLIVALLRDLARATGPLVLMTDSGDDPLIVDATLPFRELVEQWCDIDEEAPSWRQLVEGAAGAIDKAA
jgi:hypothetical protein